jgi:hypothetical protein
VDQIFPVRYDCGAVAIDRQNIIFFGGNGKDNKPMADIYVLNTVSGSISNTCEDTGTVLSPYQ